MEILQNIGILGSSQQLRHSGGLVSKLDVPGEGGVRGEASQKECLALCLKATGRMNDRLASHSPRLALVD
eukprot:32092-Pelagomonas_calceolata.AAC.6